MLLIDAMSRHPMWQPNAAHHLAATTALMGRERLAVAAQVHGLVRPDCAFPVRCRLRLSHAAESLAVQRTAALAPPQAAVLSHAMTLITASAIGEAGQAGRVLQCGLWLRCRSSLAVGLRPSWHLPITRFYLLHQGLTPAFTGPPNGLTMMSKNGASRLPLQRLVRPTST